MRTIIDVKQMTELLELVRVCEGNLSLYPDYSGRCMYGKKCFGFVLTRELSEGKLAVLLDRQLRDDEDFEQFLEELDFDNASQDSLGLDRIVYWPQIECTEEAIKMYRNSTDDECEEE